MDENNKKQDTSADNKNDKKDDAIKPKTDKKNDNTDNKANETAVTAKADQTEKTGAAGDKDKPAEPKKEKKDMLDDMLDEGDLILEDQRESYPLTPSNARFYRSKGGLISLELDIEGKDPEIFERVILLRSFPVTNPNEFLSVREPDTKKRRGKEIGMIRHITDFDEQTQMLFLEELDRRYFSPLLMKITNVKEKFGYSYWDADTSAGHVTFILNNPFSNIRLLEDGRVYINDIDGNSFEIPDPKKLDPASFRKIEIYL